MIRFIFIISVILLVNSGISSQNIHIHYLGHSAVILQFDDINVVCDYGKPNAWKQWGWDSPIYDIGDLMPDIMTYSHEHEDHYDSTRIPGNVKFILKNGEELTYKQLKIKAIPTCEDKFGEFGNTSYLFFYKGLNILHTGDIQAMIANIDDKDISEYFVSNYPEHIDILIMPVEGKIKYIKQAEKFIQFLNPSYVIPTHYWSREYLNEFLNHLRSVNDTGNCLYILKEVKELDINAEMINTDGLTEIVILERSSFN